MQNAGCLHVVAEIVITIQGKPRSSDDSQSDLVVPDREKCPWNHFAARDGLFLRGAQTIKMDIYATIMRMRRQS